MGLQNWAVWSLVLMLGGGLGGCRKKTVTIEPYSLIDGAAPDAPVIVRAIHGGPGVPWRPGSPCVLPFPESDGNVSPWLEGALVAHRKSYAPELHDLSKPIRVAFVPLAATTRPLLDSGLLVTHTERTTRLVVRSEGKTKLVRSVEHKRVTDEEREESSYLNWFLPDLSEAVARLVAERAIESGARRTPAVLYYLTVQEADLEPTSEPKGKLDDEDFERIAPYVHALQEPRRADGTPVIELSVQRIGKARAALDQMVRDHERE